MYFNIENIKKSLKYFKDAEPFNHCVIDDVLQLDIAKKLESEFIEYDDPRWYCYKNQIEDKKALNDWNSFPALTYNVFRELISEEFISMISREIGVPLYQDPGLHGGGWHIHSSGGNLNPHLDYSIHPKLGLQRKLNIIIYISSNLDEKHGGHLGLWSHDGENGKIGKLVKEIVPKYNRAIVFDTTQNSWHGMCRPLVQPEGIYRKSLAVYYLTSPGLDADPRERALFSPREDQKDNLEVRELINTRADSKNFSTVYRTK